MTTPKLNEAVAWRLRIGASDTWGYGETEQEIDFYGNQSGPPFVKEALYSAATVAALQGEVSRLRGRTDELEAFIRHWIGDGLLQTFNNREIFRADAAKILAPNLEPPTDGR